MPLWCKARTGKTLPFTVTSPFSLRLDGLMHHEAEQAFCACEVVVRVGHTIFRD